MTRKDYLLAGALAFSPLVGADTATVTVRVTVQAPPSCVINGNRPVEVDFGDVITTRVNGSNYRRQIPYTLSCSGSLGSTFRLQIQGDGPAFDRTILDTSKPGLGIEIQNGSRKLAVNSWLSFSYGTKPVLWAVPVKQAGVTLAGGEFTSGATMRVSYQ